MNNLGQRLREHGLSRVVDMILSHAKESIHLTARTVDEAILDVGASKLGGLPDLPLEVTWPEADNGPLPFVAQIKIIDVAPLDAEHLLPSSGLLSFFYGNDWDEKSGTVYTYWKVIYVDDDLSRLTRRQLPQALFDSPRYHACAVDFSIEQTLPDLSSTIVHDLRLSQEERAAYSDLYLGLDGPIYERNENPAHRLLGYPYNLGEDVLIECYLASRHRDANDLIQAAREAAHGDWSRRRRLEQEAADWRLLLQVDSNEESGMDWEASSGLIYYCITQEDLHNKNFNNVQVVAQAH